MPSPEDEAASCFGSRAPAPSGPTTSSVVRKERSKMTRAERRTGRRRTPCRRQRSSRGGCLFRAPWQEGRAGLQQGAGAGGGQGAPAALRRAPPAAALQSSVSPARAGTDQSLTLGSTRGVYLPKDFPQTERGQALGGIPHFLSSVTLRNGRLFFW